MANMQERKEWQPIHPDFVDKLLPEYVKHHNATTLYVPYIDEVQWDPAFRNGPPVAGSSPPLPVGSTKDYFLSKFKVRVFTPEGSAPPDGWPVFLFFHGGGWCLGSVDSQLALCTNMCKRANCVVVSVDYRLAPEQPYPAAVEDTEEALHWVSKNATELGVDMKKFAVGGSSSGANLAAVAAHKAALADPPIPLVFQLLSVPVLDNTATDSGISYPSWAENKFTAGLPAKTMMWFRNQYLPNERDWSKWDSSPILAPSDWFKKCPPTWISVAEYDVLRDEGIAYGEKLKNAGVPVEVVVYKGAPHTITSQDGVLQIGKQIVSDAAAALAAAFAS